MFCLFFFNDPATTEIYTLSLHDALPIWPRPTISSSSTATCCCTRVSWPIIAATRARDISRRACACAPTRRSEEHTSELQSQSNLVCRLLLEKKKKYRTDTLKD